MKKALSTVEIILSLALFLLLVLGLSSSIFYGLNSKKYSKEEMKAGLLLDEASEILYNIKDSSYVNIVEGTWGLILNTDTWGLSPTLENIDGYTRQVVINEIDDTNKEAIITVSWLSDTNIKSISNTIRLSDWERVVNVGVDWSIPIVTNTVNIGGNNTGNRVRIINNTLYTLTTSTSPNNLQIWNYSDPLNISQTGSLRIDSSNIAYDFFIDTNYAYISMSTNNREISIVNISNPASPSVSRSINLTGNANAYGIYKQGNYVYVTRAASGTASDPEFSIINATNPLSASVISNLNLGTNIIVYDIVVNGNYAYLSTSADNSELMIINITNPSAPSFVSGLNLPLNDDGYRINYDNGTVFLARTNGTIDVINVNNPLTPSLISSFNTGTRVNDLVFAYPNYNYLFIASDSSSKEFQVIDISNLSSLQLFGSYDSTTSLFGIDYDFNNDKCVVIGSDTSQEIIVISPSN